MYFRGKQAASNWLAIGVGLLLLATLIALWLDRADRPDRSFPKITVGANDEVYYSRAVSQQEALALGHALQGTGFFRDQGASVLLSKTGGLSLVSFVLHEGAWDGAGSAAAFEEIGRRIATSIGGFPIEVRLVDSSWGVHKSLAVGKLPVGAKDGIYYFGAATEHEAQALGHALQQAGYLKDLGVSVSLSKGDTTAIGFVVNDGVWAWPEAIDGFERLARRVAPSVGGLPLQLRLLNAQMELKAEVLVR